ncbi:hypothetical protein CEXT_276801 [Caerostris extrusa]|uniref:Uncharacterized protein n=1 Tax=Caerostris extrusa TaxID=172846 RepID=A0AAV4P6S8_CAEEX|nr:hypothetical protein CEXT_276801 [Caerostris extrusa]
MKKSTKKKQDKKATLKNHILELRCSSLEKDAFNAAHFNTKQCILMKLSPPLRKGNKGERRWGGIIFELKRLCSDAWKLMGKKGSRRKKKTGKGEGEDSYLISRPKVPFNIKPDEGVTLYRRYSLHG